MQMMTVAELKAALHDGEEVALLDAREEVPFDARHILMASCVPFGRIEVLASELLPRKDVRVVWCDHGEGLAASAAARLALAAARPPAVPNKRSTAAGSTWV